MDISVLVVEVDLTMVLVEKVVLVEVVMELPLVDLVLLLERIMAAVAAVAVAPSLLSLVVMV